MQPLVPFLTWLPTAGMVFGLHLAVRYRMAVQVPLAYYLDRLYRRLDRRLHAWKLRQSDVNKSYSRLREAQARQGRTGLFKVRGGSVRRLR